MSNRSPVPGWLPRRPSLSFILLAVFLGLMWLAGGASRADAFGQVVVRAGSAALLVALALFGARPVLGPGRPLAIMLAAATALVLLQLVPLPPAMWQALPGRAVLIEAAAAANDPQPWRPWSIVPGATVNAAASLLVPITALLLLAGLGEAERGWLPGMVLALVTASMVLGLLQLSGAGFNNPLINEGAGTISGSFANRNHFALLLATGCLLAPVWAFGDGRRPRWEAPAALGLVLVFALTILATGSRAGVLLGVLAIGLGLVLTARPIRRTLSRYPRWVFPAVIGGIVAAVAIVLLISVASDRAFALDRVFANDTGQDMRVRALPTVWAMVQLYFPAGSGLGGFDPLFRLHEPFTLLKLTYFNHAHNDWLEVAMDAGLPGVALLLAGLGWWGRASVRVWRPVAGGARVPVTGRVGSAILLLVMIASVFDYPARTPMIMALVVIAVWWLGEGARAGRSALPAPGQHL